MQRSGFFNALLNNGEYDRKYNANDYADNLAVVISNGVLRSTSDDLRVTRNGMVVTVGVGRAWINGHYYYNDTPYTFNAVSAPIGGARYDRVFLRLNMGMSVRSISLVYQQGEASNNPTKPAPVREGNIYDLVIADIYIGANATSVQITDTRGDAGLCGWVYSTSGDNSFFASLDAAFDEWFKDKKDTLTSTSLFKRYNWRVVLPNATNTTTFNIPQYDAETCFIEVYVNGMVETEGVDYTITGNTITFSGTLVAGTEIEVKCYKSLDGSGIMKVAEEITELQNAVAALNTTGEYEYICNGVDDNVKLSEIVREWYSTNDYRSVKINVVGEIGMKAAFGGSGTTTSPYIWFNFINPSDTNRIVTVDFTRAGVITPTIASGTYNVIFRASKINIVGANVIASNTAIDTVIRISIATSGNINYENCRFWITAYKDSYVAPNGTFTNCRASIANVTNNSYCFMPSTNGIVRIYGGEYYAYTGDATKQSAVVGQSDANAVSILYAVNAPIGARSGFYQTNSILQWVGGGIMNCTDLISELPIITVSGISNIRGTIAKNKAGNM